MSDQAARQRTIAYLLLTGAVLLMAGNIAHPVDADLTATSRFELATGSSWVAVHLALAGGFAAITVALVALVRTAGARTDLAARCCEVAAMIGGTLLVAVFAGLDGFAISSLAEAWQAAPAGDRAALDRAALTINALLRPAGMAATILFVVLGVGLLRARPGQPTGPSRVDVAAASG